ncbi:AAA-like domain-containing protein [Candidatus Babeliales bacterium]|nr:AAA-like domain-containing protein [Candidatus Babeliales bacterium]MCF7899087.1 AAA-like domain-containing protein [Candidatus Babeliales bacterium]
MKFFCRSGPVNTQDHYCLPLKSRLNEKNIKTLIDQKKYFILHAPRQTGKTSIMINFAHKLNKEGKYTALYVNVENAQAARSDFIKGIAAILEQFRSYIQNQLPQETNTIAYISQVLQNQTFTGSSLNSMLRIFAKNSKKPIMLFIDEIDSLVGDTLISVLRQLRSGYPDRPESFPQSVCLIGLRDVRDYRIWSDIEQQVILGGSAFNIKDESLKLADFTQEQVHELYLQHTQETGQEFTTQAINYAFELTQGQPWLVNALAYQACFELQTNRSETITKEIIEKSKEILILRQDTHLDVLIDRLREPRVRNIIDAIINSESAPICDDDDIKYTEDLGLIKVDSKNIKIANPIYQEILPRVLATKFQRAMSGQPTDYILDNGLLDINKLLQKFTDFYRQNSEIWFEKFDYKESGPHLIILAFLQRIVNGGGLIHREYALGRCRVDLLISWKTQRIVIELKIYRDGSTLLDGLEQTAKYMDTSNATEGHLVIFDKKDKSWEEKIYNKQEIFGKKTINIWGL